MVAYTLLPKATVYNGFLSWNRRCWVPRGSSFLWTLDVLRAILLVFRAALLHAPRLRQHSSYSAPRASGCSVLLLTL